MSDPRATSIRHAHDLVTDPPPDPTDDARLTMLLGQIAADSIKRGQTEDDYRRRLRDLLVALANRLEPTPRDGDGASPHQVLSRDLAATENAVGVLRVVQQAGYETLSSLRDDVRVSLNWLVREIHSTRRS